jgi:hypothetical protein
MGASQSAVPAIVERILDKKPNVGAIDEDGETALHKAATPNRDTEDKRADRRQAVELLLTSGTPVNVQNRIGHPALNLCRDSAIVRLLLDRGANVHLRDAVGRTPLFHHTNPDALRLLITRGADVNARNNDGDTPLMNLARLYDLDVPHAAKVLLEYGADPRLKNKNGKTALDLARDYDQADLVEVLESWTSTHPLKQARTTP